MLRDDLNAPNKPNGPTRPYGAPLDDDGPRPPRDPQLAPRLVRAGGVTIHHVDAGPRDADAVLLLPGVVSTHRYFRDNIPPLARRYRVLAPDLPGFGRSEKPDAPYSIAWFVEQVLAFMEAKQVARAHVVGNSLGGQIAMAMALAAPERVGRLVLVSPAGLMPYTEALTRVMDLVGRAAFPEVGLPRLPRIPRTALSILFRAAFPSRPDLVERWVRGYAAGVGGPEYPLYVRAAFRSMRASLQEAMHHRAREIAHPTLIIWGARDRILPPAAARSLARAIEGARLLVYAESGHCPMIDQAERWNRDVAEFLDGEVELAG